MSDAAATNARVTTGLAIAAIAISVLTLAWTIYWSIYTHRARTRPTLHVEGAYALPVYGNQLGEQGLSITVTNTGQVPVTVRSARFRIRGKTGMLAPINWVYEEPVPLPAMLSPGEHWEGHASLASMQASLLNQYGPVHGWQVQPVVSDAAGRQYAFEKWLEL